MARKLFATPLREVDLPESKVAILKASPSFVIVTTYHLRRKQRVGGRRQRKQVDEGFGIVIESEEVGDGNFSSIIIAPADLFHTTNALKPRRIKFHVRASNGQLYRGDKVACDFHYNLAALRILSDSPLQPATLRGLNDFTSIEVHSTEASHSHEEGPHSNLFKVEPGTKVLTLNRSLYKPYNIEATSGFFSASNFGQYDCKELYWVHEDHYAHSEDELDGGVINHAGEVVGIMLQDSAFLPSNFVSRWWNHYKSEKKYRRPLVGLEIANLSEACLSFLEGFRNQFPCACTGVVVTKVEKDTPAYCSGMQVKDVIVKCDDKLVHSKIEFFEQMWDNAGETVELTVLRASDDQVLSLLLTIGDTTKDKFYRWGLPSSLGCSDTSRGILSESFSTDSFWVTKSSPFGLRLVRRCA